MYGNVYFVFAFVLICPYFSNDEVSISYAILTEEKRHFLAKALVKIILIAHFYYIFFYLFAICVFKCSLNSSKKNLDSFAKCLFLKVLSLITSKNA